MPAIAEHPYVTTLDISSGITSERRPEPQGQAGRVLVTNAYRVMYQWLDRAEVLNASPSVRVTDEVDPSDEFFAIPPRRTFYVKAQYRFLGRGKSHPIGSDDD